MRLRILLAAITLLIAFAIPASAHAAGFRLFLSWDIAVERVKETGATVQGCARKAPRHFRCEATYWYEEHEAEEEEDGTLVNETTVVFSKQAICDVGIKGVKTRYLE